ALRPRLPWVRTGLPAALAVTAAAGLAVVMGEALLATGAPSLDRAADYLQAGPAGWTRVARVAAEAAALLVSLRWRRLAAVPLAAALVMLAGAGHAAAAHPADVGIAITILHLVSAGLWAGGILALALQRPPGGWLDRDGRQLLARFSPVALSAFSVTAFTGVLQGTEELSGLGDLVSSTYGQVLSVKVIAVLLMVPLSLLAWRRLRPAPRVEAALALAVVSASALLAAFPLPPARLQEAQAARAGPSAALALPKDGDLTMADNAGDVLIGLTLRPGQPGPNTAWLYVLPIGGEPAASGVPVTLRTEAGPVDVRRCGPTCREGDLDLRGGETLTVGVPGGTAAFRVPALPAADAGALLEGAERRMHDLRTYRLDETLRPARVPLSVAYAFEAPDRLQFEVSGGGDTVIIGETQYTRDSPTAPWTTQLMPPVEVPTFIWDDSPPVAPRALNAGTVSFFENQEGVPVWFRLSLDARGLVDRAAMRAQAHFMDHRYYDFDVPLTIEAP
ncbi:MAG TPA: CopD family protein, partial [Candidatus Dormibacteraeota bacterium]